MDQDTYDELPPVRMEPEERISITLTQNDRLSGIAAQLLGDKDEIRLDSFQVDNGPRVKVTKDGANYYIVKTHPRGS